MNHSPNRGAGGQNPDNDWSWVCRRCRYDDRARRRPGVLQNRDELRDRQSLLVDGRRPRLEVDPPTHTVIGPVARLQSAMASATTIERIGWTITGVEEPVLRPNAAAAEAPIKLGASTGRRRAGHVPRIRIRLSVWKITGYPHVSAVRHRVL